MNNYPTKEELYNVEKWDWRDPIGLIDYLKSLWQYETYIKVTETETEIELTLNTGGWSGHEDIILALQKNMFWSCYWYLSQRGGHYEFKIGKNAIHKS